MNACTHLKNIKIDLLQSTPSSSPWYSKNGLKVSSRPGGMFSTSSKMKSCRGHSDTLEVIKYANDFCNINREKSWSFKMSIMVHNYFCLFPPLIKSHRLRYKHFPYFLTCNSCHFVFPMLEKKCLGEIGTFCSQCGKEQKGGCALGQTK